MINNQGSITNSSSTTTSTNNAARGVQAFKPNNNPGDLSVGGFNSTIFNKKTQWTAPETGTGQTYEIYKRNDIDWDMIRTKGNDNFIGKTNREAAKAGVAPRSSNGKSVSLHHIGQNSKGPLVEINEGIHKKYHKTLHNQFGGKSNPDNPVDHGKKWRADVRQYWRDRIKDVEQ